MVKLPSPFTVVHCPVCGVYLDLKTDKNALSKHLQLDHAQTELKSVVRLLEDRLGLGHTDNLEDNDVGNLRLYVERLCQQEAATQGVKKLSRNLRKRNKRRLDQRTG
jgi:hypothetical protein